MRQPWGLMLALLLLALTLSHTALADVVAGRLGSRRLLQDAAAEAAAAEAPASVDSSGGNVGEPVQTTTAAAAAAKGAAAALAAVDPAAEAAGKQVEGVSTSTADAPTTPVAETSQTLKPRNADDADKSKSAVVDSQRAEDDSNSTVALHGRGGPETFPKFIYVYEFSTSFTTDLLKYSPKWWTEAYEAEEAIFRLLVNDSVARTTDPSRASLFFVPFFLSRFLMVTRGAHGGTTMKEAIRKASAVFESQIAPMMREMGPWFDRLKGRDHFGVIAADHGRCSLLTFVSNASAFGEMFFLQYNGDRLVRSNNNDERKEMHTLLYNTIRSKAKDVPEIACYEPRPDVLIPPYIAPTSVPITPPATTNRTIVALFRFGKYFAKEEAQAIFFNHPVRIELYSLYSELSIPRWEFGARKWEDLLHDSQRSLFCVCPPGHSQWTARPAIAVLSGCIPITFFRDHDWPFQEALNATAFTLNVDPEDLPVLKRRIDRVLKTDGALQRMQEALAAVQPLFSWDPSVANGAVVNVLRRLLTKACHDGSARHLLPCNNLSWR